MFPDGTTNERSSYEVHIEAGRLPASADETADRSGAEYSDLDQPRPL